MQTERDTEAPSGELIWLIRDSNSPICNITSLISQTNTKDTFSQKISQWFPKSYYFFSCPLCPLGDNVMQLSYTPFFPGTISGVKGRLMKIVYVWPLPAYTWHWTVYHALAKCTCYHAPAKCGNSTDHQVGSSSTELFGVGGYTCHPSMMHFKSRSSYHHYGIHGQESINRVLEYFRFKPSS